MPTWDQKLRGSNQSRVLAPARPKYKVLSIAVRHDFQETLRSKLMDCFEKWLLDPDGWPVYKETQGFAMNKKATVADFLDFLLEEYRELP